VLCAAAHNTYIRTFSGWVYAAFVIDVFARRVVGWQLSTSLHTDLALDALEMGICARRRAGRDLSQLIHHSDRGVQYRAIRYTDRLADAEAVASVGSKGDSYDNALAEAFNSLFKAELIRNKGPWRSINDLEIATAEYIGWFNHRRLHGEIGYRPPIEVENEFLNSTTPSITTMERV
jgi:putative transposase